jgi:hypothetical protein
MPHVDHQLPEATINFLVLISFMHVLMACYFFSAWGFDSVCLFPVRQGKGGNGTSISTPGGDFEYRYCRKEPRFMWPTVLQYSTLPPLYQ